MWFAALFWVFSHLGISSTPLRGTIVRLVGERGYLGIYSLIAAGALANVIWVYSDVPRFDYIWLPNPDLYWVAKVTTPAVWSGRVAPAWIATGPPKEWPRKKPDAGRNKDQAKGRVAG